MRLGLPTLPPPLPDGCIGDVAPAFTEQLWHVAGTPREAREEPAPRADDLAGETVVLVACGGRGWRHVWLPLLEFHGAGREASSGGEYLTSEEAGSTT